ATPACTSRRTRPVARTTSSAGRVGTRCAGFWRADPFSGDRPAVRLVWIGDGGVRRVLRRPCRAGLELPPAPHRRPGAVGGPLPEDLPQGVDALRVADRDERPGVDLHDRGQRGARRDAPAPAGSGPSDGAGGTPLARGGAGALAGGPGAGGRGDAGARGAAAPPAGDLPACAVPRVHVRGGGGARGRGALGREDGGGAGAREA